MAIAIKNIVVGPGTVSLGGADLGAIKKGTLELTADQEQVMIGDNENLAGYAAVYRRIKSFTLKCILHEVSLVNIKATLGLAASVGSSNPATLNMDLESGMLTSGALVITCAAPRTTAGVAQTRTITATAAVPTIKAWKYKMGVDGINEIDAEFTVLYSDGSGDVVVSDVNA